MPGFDSDDSSSPATDFVGSFIERSRRITVRTAASDGRAAGSFDSIEATSCTISSGRSWTSDAIDGGGSSAWYCSIVNASPVVGNGRSPLRISNITTPSA